MDQALAVLIHHGWIAKLPDGTVIDGKPRRKGYMLSPKAGGTRACSSTW